MKIIKRQEVPYSEILEFVELVKSVMVNATLRQQAEEELQELQAVTAARNKRQKPSKRVIQKGGIIYASDARVAVNKRLGKKMKAAAAAKKAEAQPQASSSESSGDEA